MGAKLQGSASNLLGSRRRAGKPPNPFTPGPGCLPPCLAGRDGQIRILTGKLLNQLSRKKPPPHDFAMVAQRGIGKTALLQWLQRQASGGGLRIVDLTPRELKDTRELMLQTLPPFINQTRRSASQGRLSPQAWRDAMGRAAQSQACLILADETHHLRRDVAGGLFEGVQKMRGSGFPVALIIAGTPDTWSALGEAGVSFHSRLGKGRLSLGLLDEPSSMQAVGEGLRASGLNIETDADALRMVHADSQGYPYFLQVWGEALYDGLDWPKERAITASHVEAAWAEVNQVRMGYYGDRWREMTDAPEFGPAGLAPVCAAVARGLLSSGTEDAVVADADLDNWVAAGLQVCGKGTLEGARRSMRHMGFLVNAADGLSKAGIPSLMRHALRAAITAKRVPSSWGDGLDLEAHAPKRPSA